MKKILSLIACCAFSVLAFAQTEEVFNGAGSGRDDWFIELHAGGDVLFNPEVKDLVATNGVGADVSFSFGKWVMPYFAFRIQVKSLLWQGAASADNIAARNYDLAQLTAFSDGSSNFNIFYLNPHADFMLSLYSCINGGYKASQKWDIIPFVGIGYMHAFESKGITGGDCLTGNFGLQGKYRINPMWDLNLELQASILPDYYTEPAGPVAQSDFAFTIGATYNIKGHTFSQHPKKQKADRNRNSKGGTRDTVVVYNTERIIERGAPASDGTLSSAAQSGTFTQSFQIALIEFALGSDQPKDNYAAQYYNVAAFLNAYPQAKLRLDAYCDKSTGTDEVNAKLAQRRAERVRDILVKQYGVPEQSITLNPVGSAEQVYERGELNRIVRITVLFD